MLLVFNLLNHSTHIPREVEHGSMYKINISGERKRFLRGKKKSPKGVLHLRQ